MIFNIAISEDGKYLIYRIGVPITTAIALEYAKEMRRISLETGIKFFLSDVRGTMNISTTAENYEFAHKQLPDVHFQRDTYSAILSDPEDRSHDFVETAMRNAGYKVQLFQDKTAAISWLLTQAESAITENHSKPITTPEFSV